MRGFSFILRPVGWLRLSAQLLGLPTGEAMEAVVAIDGPEGIEVLTCKSHASPAWTLPRVGREVLDLPPGEYQVHIDAPGYEPWTGPATVVPGVLDKRFERPIRLKPLP
ncbi:MAG: carboxypeptidase-like regulatory domain-containing protein [Candidatus Sumerlaeota bacterium]|nr:carboxypeptidase-like regulatory domain-containing protein [Candidatus Sumerlaeota bacterium]